VELLGGLTGLLLTEAKEVVFVARYIRDWDVGEASSKTTQNLLLSSIDEEELHVAADL